MDQKHSRAPSGPHRTTKPGTGTTHRARARLLISRATRMSARLCRVGRTRLATASALLLLLLVLPKGLSSLNQREPGEAISSLIGELESGARGEPTTTTTTTTMSAQGTGGESIRQSNSSLVVNASAAANKSNSSRASNSTSGAPNPDSDDEDRPLIIAIMTANSIIFVIGFIGNSIVILVILKFTKIETVTDIYILNLAVADLMFITGLVFLITTMFVGNWIFGYLMCKLYMASTSLNQFASSLLLVVMSFDRFLAVCHPIYAQRFRRIQRAKIICACIWIVCLILMSPIFAFAKINKDLTCAIFWPEPPPLYKDFNCEVAFTMYSFAIGFAVPLLMIAGFYLCVIRKLRIAASGPSLGSSRRSRTRETTNRRIEHLVIGIICTYTICWLPYWITQLSVSFTTNNAPPIPGFYGIFLTASSLSYTNSALNPILYAFLSDNFKRRCSDILRSIYSFRLFKCCRSGNGAASGPHQGYHAPAATTTATCCELETELSRQVEPRSALYLNESAHFLQRANNNHHAQRDRDYSAVGADGVTLEELKPGDQDTDDETRSSTIALGYVVEPAACQRKKSVNFSTSAADVIMAQEITVDDPAGRHRHTHHLKNKCQGV